ncbi:MAG: DUF3772 domain-containing protein [Paracoccaceae bacterium]|nr:DUF3772 domain-containing protein [Paracoccaceae bacterium]
MRGEGRRWGGACLIAAVLLVCLLIAASGPMLAQTGTIGAARTVGASETALPETTALDYGVWELLATRAENLLNDPLAPDPQMVQFRAQIADWRAAFLAAKGTNGTRIATLRSQIAALGAAPTDGEPEVAEIAARRKELTEQLVRLQAPSIAADEAYSRADGLIGEIDRILRERKASELLRLWPAPINPANWGAAISTLTEGVQGLWQESRVNWSNPAARKELIPNLPLIIGLLLFAAGMVLRGRGWVEGFTLRIQEKTASQGHEIWVLLTSLGQIVVPTLGVFAFASAVNLSGLPGAVGKVLVQELVWAGLAIFAARWLGGQIFPKAAHASAPLRLTVERRAEGRFHSAALGLVLATEGLRQVLFPTGQIPDAAASVLSFPLLVVAALLLLRIGHLLRRHVKNDTTGDEPPSYRNRLTALMAQGVVVVAVIGPLLAAVGYISAGMGLVYPTVLSLGMVGLLFVLQSFVGDIFALLTRNQEKGREALTPVLIGFVLVLASVPVFALIWGARASDITEVFARFREGFPLGQTRISPSDFVVFAVIFGIGYTVTRLFQGGLKSSILPKTKLDQGGQNAIVAGTGYLGIFLAALVAINSAGIDLSGLAIVAGALSVGIGFGLQNIVSNFVAGIILLIERPVSEGDWIEVGGVQGTVRAISVRSTRIQTFDRTDVIVPNSDLVSGVVTNWTRFNLNGRLIVKVGVAYGSDTRRIAAILQEIAEAQPLAVLNPPPSVLFIGFGADSLDFEIRMILRDVNFSVAVRSEVNHEIAHRFAQENIEIPFAQRDIWLRNPEALRPPPAPSKKPVGGGVAQSAAPIAMADEVALEDAGSQTGEVDPFSGLYGQEDED